MAPSAVSVTKAGGGVAVVTLAKEPVNSMNLDLWCQLQGALDQCEADPDVRFPSADAANRRNIAAKQCSRCGRSTSWL